MIDVVPEDVDRDGKDDGGVLLCRDGVKRLNDRGKMREKERDILKHYTEKMGERKRVRDRMKETNMQTERSDVRKNF